jgi:hypothetical protein
MNINNIGMRTVCSILQDGILFYFLPVAFGLLGCVPVDCYLHVSQVAR